MNEETQKAIARYLPNKLAQDNFKKTINQISNEMGGIKYTVGGQTVGKASTVESAYSFEKKGFGKFKKPSNNQAGFISRELLEDVAKKIGSVGRKGIGIGSWNGLKVSKNPPVEAFPSTPWFSKLPPATLT